MVEGAKAFKITSLHGVVECLLHSSYTGLVKEPTSAYISFPDFFPVSQLELKLGVSDTLDSSKPQ